MGNPKITIVACVFHKNGTVISLTDGQQFH
jgi:hypothetical protein